MSKVKCVFCGFKKRGAREHVFPRWLQEHLGVSGDHMGGHHISAFGAMLSSGIQSAASIVLGHVCNGCNNGWMSALEAKAAACLKPMLPRPSNQASWTSEDCRIVATWAFKTALVLNEASNYRAIAPIDHFKSLFKCLCIPERVVVDLALDYDSSNLRWRQSQTWIGLIPKGEEKKIAIAQNNSYKISFGLGSILLCVAFWPLFDYKLIRDSNKFKRLWPESKSIDFSMPSIPGGIDEFETGLYFRHRDFV